MLCLLLANLHTILAIAMEPIHIPITRRTRTAPVDLNERARRLRVKYGFENSTSISSRGNSRLGGRASTVSISTTNHVRVIYLSAGLVLR